MPPSKRTGKPAPYATKPKRVRKLAPRPRTPASVAAKEDAAVDAAVDRVEASAKPEAGKPEAATPTREEVIAAVSDALRQRRDHELVEEAAKVCALVQKTHARLGAAAREAETEDPFAHRADALKAAREEYEETMRRYFEVNRAMCEGPPQKQEAVAGLFNKVDGDHVRTPLYDRTPEPGDVPRSRTLSVERAPRSPEPDAPRSRTLSVERGRRSRTLSVERASPYSRSYSTDSGPDTKDPVPFPSIPPDDYDLNYDGGEAMAPCKRPVRTSSPPVDRRSSTPEEKGYYEEKLRDRLEENIYRKFRAVAFDTIARLQGKDACRQQGAGELRTMIAESARDLVVSDMNRMTEGVPDDVDDGEWMDRCDELLRSTTEKLVKEHFASLLETAGGVASPEF